MSDLIENATDMTNPEHREIDCKAFVTMDGRLRLKNEKGYIESDMIMDPQDGGEITDDSYQMVLKGEL